MEQGRAQLVGRDDGGQLLQACMHTDIVSNAQDSFAINAGRGIAADADNHQTRRLTALLHIAPDILAQLRPNLRAHRSSIQNSRCHARSPTLLITCWLPAAIVFSAPYRRSLNTLTSSRFFIERKFTRTIQEAPEPALEANAAPAAISLSTLTLPISAIRRQCCTSAAAHSTISSGTSAASCNCSWIAFVRVAFSSSLPRGILKQAESRPYASISSCISCWKRVRSFSVACKIVSIS